MDIKTKFKIGDKVFPVIKTQECYIVPKSTDAINRINIVVTDESIDITYFTWGQFENGCASLSLHEDVHPMFLDREEALKKAEELNRRLYG